VAFRDYFKTNYGPTITAYRNIADDPQRTAALDHDLVELARRHGADTGAMDWSTSFSPHGGSDRSSCPRRPTRLVSGGRRDVGCSRLDGPLCGHAPARHV
jgi:hypothetical protein